MSDTSASASEPFAQPSTTTTAKSAMLVQLTTDGVPKLHCPVCNKALVSLSGYVKHLKKHELPGGFICRYCDGRFCSDDALKKHRTEVHTIIMCRLCKDVTFTSEHDYREHIRIIHNGIDRQMFKCDKCEAEYKTVHAYKRHMDTECGKVKPYKCEECSISFVTKYNLKQHLELHTGERKFCCSYCGKNFKQKGRLVEHERSHTGEKPHKCDVCGKRFSHRESIVTHSTIHTGIRLVECKCCLTRFSCYSNLIKHRRTRPETCGLPQYDPPKTRMRTHKLRLPPTLNPTSEIKVSSSNRIIKPDLIEQDQKRKAVTRSASQVQTKSKARKIAGGGKINAGKRKQVKKRSTTDTEEDEEIEENVWNTNSDVENYGKEPNNSDCESEAHALTVITMEPNKLTTIPSQVRTLKNRLDIISKLRKNEVNYASDSEEDHPGLDPIESDSEDEHKNLKLSIPKTMLVKDEKMAGHDKEVVAEGLAYDEDDELEFIDSRNYVDKEPDVKSEELENMFNNKDNILDSLFDDDIVEDEKSILKHHSIKSEQVGLHETEVILVKNEDDENYVGEEEDSLAIDNSTSSALSSCKIMLLDVCERYPALKDKTSVRVPCNADSYPRRKNPLQAPKKIKKVDNSKKLLSEPKQTNMESKPEQATNNMDEENDHVATVMKSKRGRKPRKLTDHNIKNEGTYKSGRMAKISQKELRARMKLINRGVEKSWQCPYCIKMYHIRKPFEKHLREDHERSNEEIKEFFKSDIETVIKDGEVFKCHICSKIYLMEKRLLDHIKLHGPDGNLTVKCPCYCSIYFASKEEATAHAHKEHRDLLYCNICEKYMTGHDSLKNHMKKHEQEKEDSKASSKRNLVCDKCGKKFAGRTSLTDHVRSDCGRQPIYQCNVCGKNLTTAGILKTHLLLHKDDTPYQCDKCGKTFKVKAQYKTHIKTRHTDYKPFQCHLCPRAYPYRESLLTHMTVHTGIKRFLCNGCGKRFTCVSNLQAHRKVNLDTCGQLPLNAKATQYMGVQKGNLLLGAKPEAGVDYKETNTLLAKEVIDRDRPMAQEINYPSEPSAPLATVPLNCTRISAQPLLAAQVLDVPSTTYT